MGLTRAEILLPSAAQASLDAAQDIVDLLDCKSNNIMIIIKLYIFFVSPYIYTYMYVYISIFPVYWIGIKEPFLDCHFCLNIPFLPSDYEHIAATELMSNGAVKVYKYILSDKWLLKCYYSPELLLCILQYLFFSFFVQSVIRIHFTHRGDIAY